MIKIENPKAAIVAAGAVTTVIQAFISFGLNATEQEDLRQLLTTLAPIVGGLVAFLLNRFTVSAMLPDDIVQKVGIIDKKIKSIKKQSKCKHLTDEQRSSFQAQLAEAYQARNAVFKI
jgi:uncharacterized membrane protein YgaE (UPF0421/DUF939 family)